jgi:hypothetical protein
MRRERRAVSGVLDPERVHLAALEYLPRRLRLEDDGPAKVGRRADRLRSRPHEDRAWSRHAEPRRKLDGGELVARSGEGVRIGQREHRPVAKPLTGAREDGDGPFTDWDDEVDPPLTRRARKRRDRRLPVRLRRRIDDAFRGIAGEEPRTARIGVGRDHMDPAAAERADDGDRAAATGIGDEYARQRPR